MSEIILERLLTELRTPEWVISDLMRIYLYSAMPSCQEEMLQKKLTYIEQTVSDIPGQFRDLLDEWRDTVAILWVKYCSIGNPSKRNLLDVDGDLPLKPLDSIKKNVNQSNSLQISTSKEEIIFYLQNFLSSFPKVSSAIEMKLFLVELAKAEKAMNPFWRDSLFQSDVLALIAPKLPPMKWEQFLDLCLPNGKLRKTIRNLSTFLRSDYRNYYRKLNLDNAHQYRHLRNKLFCGYCKTVGHALCGCPELNHMICFNCFKSGHKARDCPEKPITKALNSLPIRCFNCYNIGHISRNCPN